MAVLSRRDGDAPFGERSLRPTSIPATLPGQDDLAGRVVVGEPDTVDPARRRPPGRGCGGSTASIAPGAAAAPASARPAPAGQAEQRRRVQNTRGGAAPPARPGCGPPPRRPQPSCAQHLQQRQAGAPPARAAPTRSRSARRCLARPVGVGERRRREDHARRRPGRRWPRPRPRRSARRGQVHRQVAPMPTYWLPGRGTGTPTRRPWPGRRRSGCRSASRRRWPRRDPARAPARAWRPGRRRRAATIASRAGAVGSKAALAGPGQLGQRPGRRPEPGPQRRARRAARAARSSVGAACAAAQAPGRRAGVLLQRHVEVGCRRSRSWTPTRGADGRRRGPRGGSGC